LKDGVSRGRTGELDIENSFDIVNVDQWIYGGRICQRKEVGARTERESSERGRSELLDFLRFHDRRACSRFTLSGAYDLVFKDGASRRRTGESIMRLGRERGQI
jgi:hypothetical protein